MRGYIGVTDNEWFSFLSQQPEIDEVNFWQPRGKTLFRGLSPEEPFFFKLHAPDNFIAGGKGGHYNVVKFQRSCVT